MNSEKVKEIKKALEFQRDSLVYLKDNVVEYISCKDILTLINELESENERLNKSDTSKENAMNEYYNLYKDFKRENQQLKDENERLILQYERVKADSEMNCLELKDRVAELEKEKEQTMKAWLEDREGMFWDGVREGELKGYKKLKQFVEMLKEKAKLKLKQFGMQFVDFDDIDETSKEFINGES